MPSGWRLFFLREEKARGEEGVWGPGSKPQKDSGAGKGTHLSGTQLSNLPALSLSVMHYYQSTGLAKHWVHYCLRGIPLVSLDAFLFTSLSQSWAGVYLWKSRWCRGIKPVPTGTPPDPGQKSNWGRNKGPCRP